MIKVTENILLTLNRCPFYSLPINRSLSKKKKVFVRYKEEGEDVEEEEEELCRLFDVHSF